MTNRWCALVLFALVACGSDEAGPTAESTIDVFMGGTVTGTAAFSQDGDAVTLELSLASCVDTKAYPVHIHQGTSCADATAQGGHWDMTRGEGIPEIPCTGTTGTISHTRAGNPAETAWTIGGEAATDIVGHVLVVHDPATSARIACGVIAQ